jgi:hypothetical protein
MVLFRIDASFAALLIAYGGISPIADPRPHKKHGMKILENIPKNNGKADEGDDSDFIDRHMNESLALNHIFVQDVKSSPRHVSAARHTNIIWGKRNNNPVCIPVPRPIDDRIPKRTHHIMYIVIL